ncbi:hypothetical protein SAMN05428975_5939 [Mucilaginibacter sp. OK268]|uniref:hypothetical protein n=1 Tax=Mucilaginibacter sp. OK268 TaxID=1881048 RepID=UPI0008891E54|nr:hypothetical protein [Mucilaginibacter sp. OK268]SDQ01694.1 hypothetical protein SAMN05428975_5939 [Mucilaginibacter sp. OK268]
MKKNTLKKIILLSGLLILSIEGCKKDLISNTEADKSTTGTKKLVNSITPYSFNWETIDWMPTPPGQSQIPPPWIGQGSIASTFGIDVVNDHKAADGWVLVYNTFNPNAVGTLQNPYFILYNKYRGLMRVYLYTTTQFVYPSTYIVDGVSVVSSHGSSMLNFLGTDIVDPSQNQTNFSQIEPAPTDGSQPLAANKWYMLQYELAYDPQIATLSYQDIQLSWFTNFNSVSKISLGGTETGTIKSPVSAPGTALNTALQKGGTVLGTGALGVIGQGILQDHGNDSTGKNDLGLSAGIFKSLFKGVTGAISGAAGGIPGAVVGLFSAIIGGSSSTPTINLNLNSQITLSGTQTTAGSFPSSPTSIYVPGTNISSSAQNYVPLYNQTLGVFNLTAKPTINVIQHSNPDAAGYYTTSYSLGTQMDQIFVTNPAVINNSSTGAQIANINQMVILLEPSDPTPLYGFTTTGNIETVGNYVAVSQALDEYDEPISLNTQTNRFLQFSSSQKVAVRVSFDIIPNNGAPKSSVIKTFWANANVTTVN